MALISVPSYVIPGTYLENLEFLRTKAGIDAVELLFFSFDDDTESLLHNELEGIAAYRNRFVFSAHLPDQLDDRSESLVEMLRPHVQRFIVHVPAEDPQEFIRRLREWSGKYGDVFAIENIPGRAYGAIADALPDLPLCIDTGHALIDGHSPADLLIRWSSRIQEVHLHGVTDNRDHQAITGTEGWFRDCLPFLRNFSGAVHIELFDYDAITPMLAAVRRAID